MHSSKDEATSTYLQEIQPRDFADLAARVHHDMFMLAGSFTSYFELFEAVSSRLTLPVSVREEFDLSCMQIRETMQRFQDLMTYFVGNSSSSELERSFRIVCSDLRNPIGVLMGFLSILQFDLAAHPSVYPAHQRAVHLIEAMLLTGERLQMITLACLNVTLDTSWISGSDVSKRF